MANNNTTRNGVRDTEEEECNVCAVDICNAMSNLRLCGQCKLARYCCKEHQKLDWKKHKVQCMKYRNVGSDPSTQAVDLADVPGKTACSGYTVTARPTPPSLENSNSTATNDGSVGGTSIDASATTGEVNNKKFDHIPKSDLHESRMQKESAIFSASLGCSYPLKPGPQQEDSTDSILNGLVKRVVKSLTTQHGICVLDKFLDERRGLAILKEVELMHSSGQFQDGQVVRSRDDNSSQIRGDQITWRNGDEADCTNISFLISVLDSILAMCNGKLEDYNINGRTKAMIACYPGNGTHYVRHVDNPNNDGRCITCIYYLNRNWDVSKNGGLLKVYPEGAACPASIPPLFNRLLFFYSDRRNPHEVLPAFATRFAITVWYLDGNQKSTVKSPVNNK